MDLSKLEPVKLESTKKCSGIIYGKTKGGKTTFANSFPNAVTLDLEGTASLVEGAKVQKINTLEELYEACTQAFKLYDTVILDGMKYLVLLFEKKVCTTLGRKSIRDHKYADTYDMLRKEVTEFIIKLLGKDKYVLFIAHDIDDVEVDETTDEERVVKSPFIPDKELKKTIPALVDFCAYFGAKKLSDGSVERSVDMTSCRDKVTGNRLGITEIITNPNYEKFMKAYDKALNNKKTGGK